VGFAFHACLLLVLVTWRPTGDDPALFHVISAAWGVCNSIWETLIYSKYLVWPRQRADKGDKAILNENNLQGSSQKLWIRPLRLSQTKVSKAISGLRCVDTHLHLLRMRHFCQFYTAESRVLIEQIKRDKRGETSSLYPWEEKAWREYYWTWK